MTNHIQQIAKIILDFHDIEFEPDEGEDLYSQLEIHTDEVIHKMAEHLLAQHFFMRASRKYPELAIYSDATIKNIDEILNYLVAFHPKYLETREAIITEIKYRSMNHLL